MTDKQMRVAMIVKDNFEQSEMEQTRERLQAADVVVDLVGVKPGQVQGLNHVDKGDSFPIDKLLDEISPDDYDAVVLPLSLIHISEPTRLGMISYAVFC